MAIKIGGILNGGNFSIPFNFSTFKSFKYIKLREELGQLDKFALARKCARKTSTIIFTRTKV